MYIKGKGHSRETAGPLINQKGIKLRVNQKMAGLMDELLKNKLFLIGIKLIDTIFVERSENLAK